MIFNQSKKIEQLEIEIESLNRKVTYLLGIMADIPGESEAHQAVVEFFKMRAKSEGYLIIEERLAARKLSDLEYQKRVQPLCRYCQVLEALELLNLESLKRIQI